MLADAVHEEILQVLEREGFEPWSNPLPSELEWHFDPPGTRRGLHLRARSQANLRFYELHHWEFRGDEGIDELSLRSADVAAVVAAIAAEAAWAREPDDVPPPRWWLWLRGGNRSS